MITIISNGTIINQGLSFKGALIVEDDTISDVINFEKNEVVPDKYTHSKINFIDATGRYVIPGVIDPHVHFRYPGAETKGDIASESRAAALGGVTSFMDMPNNNPPTTTLDLLDNKIRKAEAESFCNYSFYLGANDDNIDQITQSNNGYICGIKVFMGSSTGNMLVGEDSALESIFQQSPLLIATHCEDEKTIIENLERAKNDYGDNIPFDMHPIIRSREACIKSTRKAIELAIKYNSRLHILHLTTAEEVEMVEKAKLINPKISSETCVHYLWFDSHDYSKYGALIKCNPAIKTNQDREALINAINRGVIDIISTDHAPHLLSEKMVPYIKSPSGMPSIQHSLLMMIELYLKRSISLETIVQKMCHAPAEKYGVLKRGFLKKGYYADIAILSIEDRDSTEVSEESLAYKCKWSPILGHRFSSSVKDVFVNGVQSVKDGLLTETRGSKKILFITNQ